jgi:hypothetical protein
MAKMRNAYRILFVNLSGSDNLGDIDVDENVVLKWILYKWDMRMWIGFIWLRIGTNGWHL